jgi:hypothetical protein
MQFHGVTICSTTLSAMCYLFYYTECSFLLVSFFFMIVMPWSSIAVFFSCVKLWYNWYGSNKDKLFNTFAKAKSSDKKSGISGTFSFLHRYLFFNLNYDFDFLAWISRNKFKSKLRLKSEILLKFEKYQKNVFLEKLNLRKNLSHLPTKLKSKNKNLPITIYPPLFSIIICVFPVTSRKKIIGLPLHSQIFLYWVGRENIHFAYLQLGKM